MAVALYFAPPAGMSGQQYDQITAELEAAGAGAPDGRTYHAAFGTDDRVMVFDVWESMEQFERFGETLMPILQRNGVDPGEPQHAEVRNVMTG